MKDSVAYIATFLFAFILVTSAMFIANEKYNNVFKLDFSPRNDSLAVPKDSLKLAKDSLAKVHADSIAKVQQADSLKKAETEAAKTTEEKANNGQLVEKQSAEPRKEKMSDSSYVRWKRETIKLYEAMEAKQIAKLILSFPDDVARDLIYSMKKKKAAEVLSILSPEAAHRLTKNQ